MADPSLIPTPPTMRGLTVDDEFTLECLRDCTISLADDRPPQEIVRDRTRVVTDEATGRTFHPPLLDEAGCVQQVRIHKFALRQGQRLGPLGRRYQHSVWSMWCGLCGRTNSTRGGLCRREDHRKAGHWQVVGGQVTPRQVAIVGETYKRSFEVQRALEEDARLEAEAVAATPDGGST